MPGKQLSKSEIDYLLANTGRRKKIDTTEPRTIDNWWKQTNTHFINKSDTAEQGVEAKCGNPYCKDPRKDEDTKIIILAEIKDTLMCRFCFLDGWLSKNG